MFPQRLKKGDHVRIIAPARSMALPFITPAVLRLAQKRLEDMGLKVSFGKHVRERDVFDSSSVRSRVQDVHDAFTDPSIKMIHTIIGGFNSSQLLPHLDYELIKKNPKILCGYSDITALATGIFVKTGVVTYSGPHFFDFGDAKGIEYTRESFRSCLFLTDPYMISPSVQWSDDLWAKNQNKRNFVKNSGPFVIRPGQATGKTLGGNLITLQHLAGTPYFPHLEGAVLFVEDDKEEDANHFESNLTALSLIPEFSKISALLIGRFQKQSKVSPRLLEEIISRNSRIPHVPVIGGVDFGHTTPRATFPIGGTARITAHERVVIEILSH